MNVDTNTSEDEKHELIVQRILGLEHLHNDLKAYTDSGFNTVYKKLDQTTSAVHDLHTQVSVMLTRMESTQEALQNLSQSMKELEKVVINGTGNGIVVKQRVLESKVDEIQRKQGEFIEEKRFRKKHLWTRVGIAISALLGLVSILWQVIANR